MRAGLGGLSYEDLCIHPDVELPEGYKLPKFEMFNGIGYPKAHLRMYCNKLVGVGRDVKILMKLSHWGGSIMKMHLTGSIPKEKPSESFRDYAIRWRSEAARARHPMEESQMKDYFIRAQEP
ncbi:hypothetical protein H5410_001338 [Solanum commersonii]|uniref:Uncharacterized protein n=1 Tax=Solanum commersonii TaxID=4109 RepID=A0A9J6AYF4_SOLCO|nr:hypothetical protein H5410_001338 [Solanum commersonii]